MMKVKTAKPMTTQEVFDFTGYDALYDIDGYKVRIMNFSPDQEVECNLIKKDSKSNLTFGLKKVEGKEKYQYLAFLIQ